MLQILCLMLITLLSLHVPTSLTALTPTSQYPLDHNGFPTPNIPHTFRPAKSSDISDITDVIIDAFDPGPDYQYAYQFKDKYPVYHRECMRQTIEQQWNQFHDQDFVFLNVIEVPITPDDKSSDRTLEDENQKSRVVSIGLWQVKPPSSNSSTLGINNVLPFPSLPLLFPSAVSPPASSKLHPTIPWPNCTHHLDANTTRALNFSAQFISAEHIYIDTAYPSGQVYLEILATHPDYDGHNFGATHCGWGMKLAEARGRGEPVTLMATPAGYPLYESLGFKSVKNVSIEMLDGLGVLWYEVMRWGFEQSGK